jgi:nucleolar GTP-binding protein
MAALLLASATGAARALLPAARAGRGGGTLFSSAAARGRAATVPVQRPFSFSYSAAVATATTTTTLRAEAEKAAAMAGSDRKRAHNMRNRARARKDRDSNTGGLRRLPVVRPARELVDRARKAARAVRADAKVKNARGRARKHGAETLNAVTQSLCVPLRDCIRGYRSELRGLHPFEAVVADLTVRARQKRDGLTLDGVLEDLNEARKEVLLAGKDWVARCKAAETAREAAECMEEGEEALYDLFQDLAGEHVAAVISLQKSLRTTPAVRLDTPAVVLVGSPNVGKSSIVRAISSATPEVSNYPFTTRGMTLGHVEVFWQDESTAAGSLIPEAGSRPRRSSLDLSPPNPNLDLDGSGTASYAFSQLCQVMDSPGMLVRPDSERNEMEALTLAAMQHLPTAVMYVMDLSGGAGDRCSSVEDQLLLRREVRARFPRRPWIDVVSKYDLDLADGAREALEETLDGAPYLEVSIQDGTGVDGMRDEVMRMLGEVRVVLDAMAAVDERTARPTR